MSFIPNWCYPYWVTFTAGDAGCVEAASEAAAEALAWTITSEKPSSVKRLPYAADPRLNKWLRPDGAVAHSFCMRPNTCQGRTSCPLTYSCTE